MEVRAICGLLDGELIQPFQQIMDPKMDSGYLQPGETLEDEYDVKRELLPTELLGIMDQMLCYEVGVSRKKRSPGL